jgi:hypothetical protein
MKRQYLWLILFVLLFINQSLFSQNRNKQIFGFASLPNTYIGMTAAEFRSAYRGKNIEEADLENNKLKRFLLRQYSGIELIDFYFYDDVLIMVSIMCDSNEITLERTMNILNTNYGDFIAIDEKKESVGVVETREILVRHTVSSEFNIEVVVFEMYMGGTLFSQQYGCQYINPIALAKTRG